MIRFGKILPCILFLMLARNAHTANSVSGEWIEKWRQDLQFAQTEMPKLHPNLFHAVSREEFDAQFARLKESIPARSHAQVMVELARIIASLNDGHTRLTLPLAEGIDYFQGHSKTPDPKIPELIFHQYPIRFFQYSDGLYVRKIDREYAEAAGGHLTRIGKWTTEEALAKVSPLFQNDNIHQLQSLAPIGLTLPEMMQAVGLIDNMESLEVEVQTPQGEARVVRLKPVPPGVVPNWTEAHSGSAATPLYLKNTEIPFRFEYLQNAKTVYFQYNEVTNTKDETIEQFADRLFSFIETNEVERLVIDVRWNRGGNNSLSRPLLHGLICSRKLQETGSLFAIIGRDTFSAAMMFALDLERHTPTIFVGEPTGSRPNHYGDSRKMLLPNTGLTIRVSSLYWQYSDPRDRRIAIEPQIGAVVTPQDFLENRDPALDTILSLEKTPAQPDGAWEGTIFTRFWQFRARLTVRASEGSIDVEELGLQDTPVKNFHYAPPVFTFETAGKRGEFQFRAKLRGNWMIGDVSLGEYSMQIVMHR